MCSHPVIYHIDGHLKCISCGEILDQPKEQPENVQNQAENTHADAGTNKSPSRKRQAKNAK